MKETKRKTEILKEKQCFLKNITNHTTANISLNGVRLLTEQQKVLTCLQREAWTVMETASHQDARIIKKG